MGRYIVDFYCAQLKLAIELDGSHHEAPWLAGYDGERTWNLEKRGIRVLRIPNELLIRDSMLVGELISAVIEQISNEIGFHGEPPHPPSAPSPPCAGEKDLDGED